MSEPTFYLIWVKDRKEETQKEIIIPHEYLERRGGGSMAIKDYACDTKHFSWSDYTKIRHRKMKTVY